MLNNNEITSSNEEKLLGVCLSDKMTKCISPSLSSLENVTLWVSVMTSQKKKKKEKKKKEKKIKEAKFMFSSTFLALFCCFSS